MSDQMSLHSYGTELEKDGSGGLVQFEKSEKIESFILVVKVPNRPELAQIRSGLILLYDSKLLRRLCEINESSRGIAGKWNCKKKGEGRLHARCSSSGCPQKSESTGKRHRVSVKVECPAEVRTGALPMETRKGIPQMKSIAAKILGNSFENEMLSANETSFCVIVAKTLEHDGHIMR
eukprot:IDg22080t1